MSSKVFVVAAIVLTLCALGSAPLGAIAYGCDVCWRVSYDFALCMNDRSGIGGFKVCWVERDCDFDLCFESCYEMYACMWA